MTEFEPHKTQHQLDEKTVKEIHFHFVHQQTIKRGHTLFKFNSETGVLEVVKREKKTLEKTIMPKRPKLPKGQIAYMEPTPPGIIHTQTSFDPKCLYFGALNMENAQRRVNQLVGFDLGWEPIKK
jgi:hypothetical protein